MDNSGDGRISIEEFTFFIDVVGEVTHQMETIQNAVEKKKKAIEEAQISAWEIKMEPTRRKSMTTQEHKAQTERSKNLKRRSIFLAGNVESRKQKLGPVRKLKAHELNFVNPDCPLWKQHHFHRIITVNKLSYCCICRRRKWELEKVDRDEVEIVKEYVAIIYNLTFY